MSFGMTRPPLQGIGNFVHRPPPQTHQSALPKGYPHVPFNRKPNHVYSRGHHFVSNTMRGMIPDGNRAVNVGQPKKKQRTSSNEHPSQVNRRQKQHLPKKINIDRDSSPTSSELLIKQWLVLPQSLYGINYDLGTSTTLIRTQDISGISILEMAANKSPFELKMQQLRNLLQSKYPQGASLVFVREIFEPGDVDYAFSSSLPRPPSVDVTKLARHQVDRLRLMVIPANRQAILMSYLSTFEMLPFDGSIKVADHFSTFRFKYSKIRDCRVKFSQLFCFTFALNRYDGWMYRQDNDWGRQKVVEGLALRWKNLLKFRSPDELGIDRDFSYPAVLSLLLTFKRKVERLPTYDEPRMLFKYEV